MQGFIAVRLWLFDLWVCMLVLTEALGRRSSLRVCLVRFLMTRLRKEGSSPYLGTLGSLIVNTSANEARTLPVATKNFCRRKVPRGASSLDEIGTIIIPSGSWNSFLEAPERAYRASRRWDGLCPLVLLCFVW